MATVETSYVTMIWKWTYKRLSIQYHRTPGKHTGFAMGLLYVPSIWIFTLVAWRREFVILFNAGKKLVTPTPAGETNGSDRKDKIRAV